jgi:hypothetical protein
MTGCVALSMDIGRVRELRKQLQSADVVDEFLNDASAVTQLISTLKCAAAAVATPRAQVAADDVSSSSGCSTSNGGSNDSDTSNDVHPCRADDLIETLTVFSNCCHLSPRACRLARTAHLFPIFGRCCRFTNMCAHGCVQMLCSLRPHPKTCRPKTARSCTPPCYDVLAILSMTMTWPDAS